MRVTGSDDVVLPLSDRELRLVLGWRSQGAFFPDEERVLRKLRRALEEGTSLEVSRMQLQILHGWAEEMLGGPYGGGEVVNRDEAAVLGKLRQALGYD